MFSFTRLIIGCILYVCCCLIIKHSNASRKSLWYGMSFAILFVVVSLSALIPFENKFIEFDSVESAFSYFYPENTGIELVVEGVETDLVVGKNGDSFLPLIVPKSEDRWKLGVGANTRTVCQEYVDGCVVKVLQYSNSDEYYITVLDTAGGTCDIFDSCASNFYLLYEENQTIGKVYYTYFAYISNFSEDYYISINGKNIYFTSI